jgi:hypothetical protein
MVATANNNNARDSRIINDIWAKQRGSALHIRTILKMKLKKILEPVEIIGKTINKVVTATLLTIIYFTSVGLTSIAAKMTRKTFLQTRTRWNNVEKNERYYQQF